MTPASDRSFTLRFPALSDSTLSEIARLAGVSQSTVARVLQLRREASELLARAVRFHAHARELVYFVQAEGQGHIKIGTTKNLARRIKVLRASSPVPLRLVGLLRGGRRLERLLHLAFAPLRRGRTEWFEPGESLVSYVRDLRRAGR